ncbi:MAG TPA: M20/M25/M40 family metallo-hydrolase [Thermoanaerobaculia bacterium]|nr:M20/M25/M40 family metallo-hydrolase [Thermoanaerobaculia bacterium]
MARSEARALAIPASRNRSGDELDWTSIGEEALALLGAYIRFPTVNDPQSLGADEAREAPWRSGREAEAAAWLADQLAADGIEAELLESAPGRVNLIARVRGSGAGRPILLLSHSDVVPAVRGEWSHGIDPFGGEVREGYLYGRGALDLKGLGIAHLMTLKLLQRTAPALQRDVVLLIVADEEAGGRYGAQWLLEQRPELRDADLVLGEGAYSPRGLLNYPGPIHAIAAGEKGYLELELTADQAAHHASMPAEDNAPARLVRALERVLAMERRLRITPLASQLLRQLAPAAGGLHRLLMRNPRWMARLAPGPLSRSAILSSMLQDKLAVTVLAAGQKHNVVPSQARAVLSIRLLPETDPVDLTARIERAVADPAIEIRRLMHKPANLSRWNTRAFEILSRHAAAQPDKPLVVPILSPGASDCRFWRALGVSCYGWIPFVIPGEDLHRVHGPDERVSLEAFRAGLRSYYEAVHELAATDQELNDER